MSLEGAAKVGLGAGAGKVILLGEHAVVYGYPALAVGLAKGIEATATPADDAFCVVADAWDLRIRADEDTPHGRALSALTGSLGLLFENVTVHIHPHIPARAGLGASAAMAVATARSLMDYYNRKLPDELLFFAVQASEKIFHGNPSGLDASMAIRGGAALYTKKNGLCAVHATLPQMRIVHSGAPKDTAQSVARFAARMAQAPDESRARLERMGEIVQEGRRALEFCDMLGLGALMTENHRHLQWFNVSTPALDLIVDLALQNGALGAKLTGGGGGGCAVLLVPDDETKISRALRSEGFETVIV